MKGKEDGTSRSEPRREPSPFFVSLRVLRALAGGIIVIAVLGLTFKSGTDDLREAPSIDNLKLLLAAGASVYAFDPKGQERAKELFPQGKHPGGGTMNYVSSATEALEGAHICFVFTEWPQIREVAPGTFKEKMHTPLVYDGRNLYQPAQMKAAGVEYYSIGR